MAPVATPDIAKKQDLRTVARDARVALKKSNGRLADARTWYEALRQAMSQ